MNRWKWIGLATLIPMLCIVGMGPVYASVTTGEIEQLKTYLESNPTAVREAYKLGALYFLSKRFDEAIDVWSRILANKSLGLAIPSKVKVAKGLALANFKVARYDKAYKFIRWVYKNSPDDPKVKKAYDVIKRAYDNSLSGAVVAPPASPTPPPDSAGVVKTPPSASAAPALPPVSREEAKKAFAEGEQAFQEGRIFMEQVNPEADKRFVEVIKQMEIAKRGDYNMPRALFFLGSAHLFKYDDNAEDLDKARSNLEESLKLDLDKTTLFNLAQVYGLKLEKDKEIEHYERALELDSKWAECHFRLALAYDKSARPDAARKTFEHAKAAIRERSEYKKKFQEVLKNSDVAKQIASIVSEIIEKSENDQLTDAETEKYAQKFQQMLGEKNLTTNDLKDKNKMKELLQSEDAKKYLGDKGISDDKLDKLMNSPGAKKLLDRGLKKIEEKNGGQ